MTDNNNTRAIEAPTRPSTSDAVQPEIVRPAIRPPLPPYDLTLGWFKTSLLSGNPVIDLVRDGLSELTILDGPPSVAKSRLAEDLALGVAAYSRHTNAVVALVTLHEPAASVVGRLTRLAARSPLVPRAIGSPISAYIGGAGGPVGEFLPSPFDGDFYQRLLADRLFVLDRGTSETTRRARRSAGSSLRSRSRPTPPGRC